MNYNYSNQNESSDSLFKNPIFIGCSVMTFIIYVAIMITIFMYG